MAGLASIIGHREFQSMDYEQQVALLSNIVGQVSPELAGDPDQLTTFTEQQIRIHRPRTPFEQAGSFITGFIPIAGPLIQRYGFQEEVPPPALLSAFGAVDDDNPYGALIRAGIDIPLMIGGSLIGGIAVSQASRFLPSLLHRSVPALISRELIAGAASGTGELALDPPQSVAEGTVRLGLSAVGQAAFTTSGRLLFGADARLKRAINREMGKDGFAEFNAKVDAGRLADVTDNEIAGMERALGNRTDPEAQRLRHDLTEIKNKRPFALEQQELQENLSRQAFQEQKVMESEGLSAQLREQSLQDSLREADTSAQEQISIRQQAESMVAADAQRRQETLQAGEIRAMSTEQLMAEIRQRGLEDQLRESNVRAQEQIAFRQQGQGFYEGRFTEAEESVNARIGEEQRRVDEITGLIKQVEKGPISRGDTQFLKSEQQLLSLLDDVRVNGSENARFPFVNNEPTTLPLAMIQDLGEGKSRAVVVDNLSGNRASLRSLGMVDRNTLRLPQTSEEKIAVGRIEAEQRVGAYPDFDRARSILQSRIEGERATRLAALEARRFGSEEAGVQREIFRLRREATLKYLEAGNAEVEPGTVDKVKQLRGFDDKRTVGSVEQLNATDAEALGKSLRSAGFENVRLALDPNGTFSVVLANASTPNTQRATSLFNKYVTNRGTFDPTSGATYGGLTPEQHAFLGQSFGIDKRQQDRFNDMASSYIKELRDRGIRFPVTNEAMGIDLIEDQLAKNLKRPQPMRSDVIARSAYDVRRIDVGDTIEYQGQKGPVHLHVLNKEQVHDPDGLGGGVFRYDVIPKDMLAEGQPIVPLTEKQLREVGAKRSTEFPIAAEAQPAFTMESPSRFIGDLFGMNRNQMPVPVVEPTGKAIKDAASELGLKATVFTNGKVRLSGQRVDLTDLTHEDAALMLSRLRQMRQDRTTLLDFFRDCI